MKAVRYHSYGDSSVLVYEEADRPVAGPGQVVVKVAGAAFNPLDVVVLVIAAVLGIVTASTLLRRLVA